MSNRFIHGAAFILGLLTVILLSAAPPDEPIATIDLTSLDGAALVKAEWRYSDTRIIQTAFRMPDNQGQPNGPANTTYDFEPHAGAVDFDDSSWQAIPANSLGQRRGNGRLSFNWYRVAVTIPERVQGKETRGSTVSFETSLDDYAEIWVDGELTRALGQEGGSVIAGWNAPNRLVIGRNVKPGQKIHLAIFGINGPLSNPPSNYIFMRYARLSFRHAAPGPVSIIPAEVNVEVTRLDPAIDQIVPQNAKVHKLAEGFEFTEGPVWVGKRGREQAHLLFSDPNANTIYKFVPGTDNQAGQLTIFRKPSGYSGNDIAEYGQPGSNGLTLDPQGRLTINEHGNRRVSRVEKDGTVTILADNYDGKRLNSPNDLVYRSDGTLFFTDPPFGLPKFAADPRKELPFSGVFSLYRGQLRLLTTEHSGPNGIALSPDERYLYVANWDDHAKLIRRYEVRPDSTLTNGTLFFDMTRAPGEDALDGVKVDVRGNVYVSGPGGLWILSPQGIHLGTIVTPRHPHNFAWGDDGKTLYIAARSVLYRMRLNVEGVRP
jgi:gluconolactonase